MPPTSATEFRKLVGARLAALRRAAELTQERLAERLQVSTRYVQSVESGRENLTLDSLVRLAAALATDPTALLSGEAAPRRPKRRRRTTAAPPRR